AYFKAAKGTAAQYQRTGMFAFELYTAKKSSSWLNPAYSDGTDDWAGGAFRFNAYWFTTAPDQTLPGIWQGMRDNDIPYRYHWGKLQPPGGPPAVPPYEHWDDFLALRSRQDPEGMFLTPYWRERLGIVVSQ